jgi:hypothetical protein
MKLKLIEQARFVGICLILLFSMTAFQSVQSPMNYTPIDATWTGTTSRGYPMSFNVSSTGTQWNTFKLKTDFNATNCGATGTIEITVPGPGSITNDQFSYTSSTYSFTGQFNSISTASGAYSFINRQIVIGLPYPPYVCYYYLTQSGTWSASTPLPPPGDFSKSDPISGATGQPLNLTLTWNPSAYADNYQYCIDLVDNNDCDTSWEPNPATSNTSIELSGLASGTTYYWQVRATNSTSTTIADGNTWWSFTTELPPGSFGKVVPSDMTINQPTNPTLSWNTSTGATSYEYCYDTTNDSACTGSWTSTGSNTSIGLSGLTTNTAYYWQVRAVNLGGTTDANGGTWWTFTTIPNPPGTFNKASPVDGAVDRPLSTSLFWWISSGAASYEYCYHTSNNDFCDGSWISNGTNNRAYPTLSPDTTYYWQVRAVNPGGVTYANGGNWWSFTTVPPVPPAFSKTSPVDGAINQPTLLRLTFEASAGATDYEFCYDTINNNDCDHPQGWGGFSGRTYVDISGLSNNTTYYWQVRANNAGGTTYANTGAWWSFTTLNNIRIYLPLVIR